MEHKRGFVPEAECCAFVNVNTNKGTLFNKSKCILHKQLQLEQVLFCFKTFYSSVSPNKQNVVPNFELRIERNFINSVQVASSFKIDKNYKARIS